MKKLLTCAFLLSAGFASATDLGFCDENGNNGKNVEAALIESTTPVEDILKLGKRAYGNVEVASIEKDGGGKFFRSVKFKPASTK